MLLELRMNEKRLMMMTLNVISVLLFLVTTTHADNLILTDEEAFLIGTWKGQGQFLDTDIKSRIGEVPVQLILSNSGEIDFRFNDQTVHDPGLKATKYGFEIKGEIDGFERNGVTLDKHKILLLMVFPEAGRDTCVSSDANFHLKSNFFFDFTFRVGGVVLVKEKSLSR